MLESEVQIREATEADNLKLIELTEKCPMIGDISLCYERGPNFFALNRLEGENFSVLVAEEIKTKNIVGCVSGALRKAWMNGESKTIHYASDLKVNPDYRSRGIADQLSKGIIDVFKSWNDPKTPIIMTILTGNQPMEKRSAIRGLPHLEQFSLIKAHSVTLMWKRRMPKIAKIEGYTVSRATSADIEPMMELWRKVAPGRQFSQDFSAEKFSEWVSRAPGLSLQDYFLAKDKNRNLKGFFALWEQDVFKKCRVLGYGKKMANIRRMYNLLLPLMGAPRLPPPGGYFRSKTALHICVPSDAPQILRMLTIGAYNEIRQEKKYAFFTLGLDINDPLCKGLDGLMAQPTLIGAYVTTAEGKYEGPPLGSLPVHFEISLV